ncbi:MAG: T9SS type A sorting domain-containing protein [Bacteroidetes bacterium]|nr:T9SS type A sorting domain-containing protein [Bacteroidota bacterium]
MKKLLLLLSLSFTLQSFAQMNIVSYAGSNGKETFYDVMQITDGTFLICGYADDLNWIDAGVQRIQLNYPGIIPNSLGSNRYGFILHLSSDLQTILQVVHFPQGVVEDIRFIKTNTLPYTATGDLYISANTADSDANNGGYIIGKLDNNFVNGLPTALEWLEVVWAKSGPKDYHPWDVTNDGRVFYISGEAFGYDWSAVYCLNQNGQRAIVENWRTHWLKNGFEFKGTPASSNPQGGIDSVDYSGIVLKIWGRCDLRSWTQNEYDYIQPDGNGGTKKGSWPADLLFNGPCDPASPTATGPGYTGYSAAAGSPVYGGTNICIDKRNNNLYLGVNFKSVTSGGSPDFEPAVIAMNESGTMLWWSRLYHEITPAGDTMESVPDQYVDALAIDYSNNKLVVGARCHGNNIENFWEGNQIASDPAAYGFQNQFTGTNGNIHLSWLGKFLLNDGTLTNSTFMGEYAEGTGSLGTPHADPNLDGWADPNTGWPDVNTTRIARNNMKVSSSGDVCVIAVGRRTTTTSNAFQKMVKPDFGGLSAWNSFVRVYDSQFHVPKYSSLVVGVWDTLTQAGGGNTELFGIYKTSLGVICVGRQTADTNGIANGNNIPLANVLPWGSSSPLNESAILVYYQAGNLVNIDDSILTEITTPLSHLKNEEIVSYPNPSGGRIFISFTDKNINSNEWQYRMIDGFGRMISSGVLKNNLLDLSDISNGIYQLQLSNNDKNYLSKVIIVR